MIILLRVVFAAGLLAATALAIAFLVTRDRARLKQARRVLLYTCALGLLFFAVMMAERLLA
ncbi:MAG: hypothetical protein KJZ83_20035 [Burkholderiaceae bacterium]|nr:hypothetical protein [Burkholderiaceae bacterium]